MQVIKDPALRERNLGDLQGHVYNELSKTTPVAYQAFVSNRTDQEIPVSSLSSCLAFNSIFL